MEDEQGLSEPLGAGETEGETAGYPGAGRAALVPALSPREGHR